MKKFAIVILLISFSVVLINCNSTKSGNNAYTSIKPTLSYKKDIRPIMEDRCTPCHFPPDGRKEPLNDYSSVKAHIGEIIERVSLPKDDKKFMPAKNKKPALNDSLIAVLVKWRLEKMPE